VLLLQHLLPLLARPGAWDVLIAHYLGVDHAGHTYGVVSKQMEAKLDQMDSQISQVIGERRIQMSLGILEQAS
jgi:phosphatidylinositol glycan class O